MKRLPRIRMNLLVLAMTASIWASDVLHAQDSRIDFFEKKIRPLLVVKCLECHSKDERAGKLDLDSKAGWERGGERGPAIVPRDPDASLLFRAITHRNKSLRMPPPDSHDPLTKEQIADVENWIRNGAIDPRAGKVVRDIDVKSRSHWAFKPIATSFPDFGQANPIDFFIDQGLQSKKLTATPRADYRTLVRRATFDLIGLPPTKNHLKVGNANFDELVQQLLESPQYGERWARHWLDVARYSDAKDGVLMYGDARIRPFAYTYRDYVIRAFNDDLPFDDFVRHQLAADQMELPQDSPSLAAMGFLTLGRMFDRNRHDIIDDQIDVVTRGFLGLTVSCARCHDHKFDPVPTADYYSLYGVFASTIEPLQRPRISKISQAGTAYEKELKAKLDEIESLANSHYKRTLETAQRKTSEYLTHIATTDPDYAETAIFFKSLIPGQLRPQIVHRWRKLIAKRAHPDDPMFGPWHDLFARHERFQNRKDESFWNKEENDIDHLAKRWSAIGTNLQLIEVIKKANPIKPREIAIAYGSLIESFSIETARLNSTLAELESKVLAKQANRFNIADIVAGGSGFGTGKRGKGIHPATGNPTEGQTGFIEIPKHDQLVPVKSNPLVDGVFVPRSGKATISSTGIGVDDLPKTGGKTWDYFKFDLSSGSTETKIGDIDYSQSPNWVMAMHANKGITFDLEQFRKSARFDSAEFRAVLGNSGAAGQSQIDFHVYLDGKRVVTIRDFPAQSKGRNIRLPIQARNRFLTLVALEGKQGISHDQVVLGNPAIYFERAQLTQTAAKQIDLLKKKIIATKNQIDAIEDQRKNNPLFQLIASKDGPVWFPKEEIEFYLSRQDRDRFRGLLNQIDSIGVRHPAAADRAMVLRDRNQKIDPVIFQRGDPSLRGTPVSRSTLSILDRGKPEFRNGSGRLELAESIVSNNNPLTARVWVNRVWLHHFGEPLVASPSDFGLQTERPLQHQLLDYLASTLIRNGWRTKPLHRLIMSSNAYQRSSVIPKSPKLRSQVQLDPDNSYFWRANRRRLDLEQMRDAMLQVAGNLSPRMYGRPQLITDLANQRRTIYAFVERQNIPNVVQSFDFANADSSTARRPQTTVPQQALFAMNSPFVIQQSKLLAKAANQLPDNKKKVEWLFDRILARAPTNHEQEVVLPEVERNGIESLAHVLLISNEFMFVD